MRENLKNKVIYKMTFFNSDEFELFMCRSIDFEEIAKLYLTDRKKRYSPNEPPPDISKIKTFYKNKTEWSGELFIENFINKTTILNICKLNNEI